MTAGVDEAVLERLRVEGDTPAPPFGEERRCAYQPCSKPLQRKAREKSSQFTRRRFCDQACAARNATGSGIVGDLPERECVCGGTIRQRANEHPSRFAARQYCSPACASRHIGRATAGKQRKRRPVETKPCAQCGKPMTFRQRETTKKWQERETCSLRCGAQRRKAKEAAARAAHASVRVCGYPVCGKPLVQRDDEPPYRFRARQFCGLSCATANRNTAALNRGLAESKPCEGCPTVMVRGETPPYQWRVKRFCSPGCASRSRTRTEPKVVPSKDWQPPTVAIPEAPAGPAKPVWRPAGWSPIPNVWAGHRAQVSLTKATS